MRDKVYRTILQGDKEATLAAFSYKDDIAGVCPSVRGNQPFLIPDLELWDSPAGRVEVLNILLDRWVS